MDRPDYSAERARIIKRRLRKERGRLAVAALFYLEVIVGYDLEWASAVIRFSELWQLDDLAAKARTERHQNIKAYREYTGIHW